ncbi:MAG: pyridoxamine 5'-phosphate oxidase family protein, partial [Pseudomonadota bacterium]
MGKMYESIDSRLQEWIKQQKVFFVASAPLSSTGHVNCSPKGGDCLRVLDGHTVVYEDYVGSGAETIAHVRENGRIVLMFV